MGMERQVARIVANKALEAIKAAFAADPNLKQFSVSDGGGSIGAGRCVVKFEFLDNNHKPTCLLGGELNDEIVSMGLAGAGTPIMYQGKRYKVVKVARKFYNAIDSDGKPWRVPIIGSTLARD